MIGITTSATSARDADYAWPVVRVIDGDTVEVNASANLPPELELLKVRLRGADTPEKEPRASATNLCIVIFP